MIADVSTIMIELFYKDGFLVMMVLNYDDDIDDGAPFYADNDSLEGNVFFIFFSLNIFRLAQAKIHAVLERKQNINNRMFNAQFSKGKL